MPYVFQTIGRNGNRHPRWRFQYTDRRGKRRTSVGTTSRIETVKIALRIENEEFEIRKGIRPAPRPSSEAKYRDFADVVSEYCAWGLSQGGWGGRSWSKTHARMRRAQLAWWVQRLELKCLGQLEGILPRAEAALRELQGSGCAGRTVQGYADTLRAFCRWCVKRRYLDEQPLADLARFDITPEVVRRAMTLAEVGRLMKTAPSYRRLLYQVAICSGLRAGELRSLTTDDLDVCRRGLSLRSKWTKNRRSGFQPLPSILVQELSGFVASGAADGLYRSAYAHKPKARAVPERPLLYMPHNTARVFDRDLHASGIPKVTPEGKLDFHALRVTYVTLLVQAGAYVKEAQSLARHSDPKLTMNVYAKVFPERLTQLVENVGQPILEDKGTIQAQQETATIVTQSATECYVNLA
mgnify:FL=1